MLVRVAEDADDSPRRGLGDAAFVEGAADGGLATAARFSEAGDVPLAADHELVKVEAVEGLGGGVVGVEGIVVLADLGS